MTVRNEYPQVSVKNIFVASADTSFISDKLYDDICCGNEKTVYYNSQGERYVYDYYSNLVIRDSYHTFKYISIVLSNCFNWLCAYVYDR